jgi:DNA-binding transcriptional regulator YiaG
MTELTPVHCRAARGALQISQEQLAVRAGVSLSTVRDFEAERRRPMKANLRALRQVLEEAGVELLPAAPPVYGPGLRLKYPPKPEAPTD